MEHNRTHQSVPVNDAGPAREGAPPGRASPARSLLDRARRISRRPNPLPAAVVAPVRAAAAPRTLESVELFLVSMDRAIERLQVRELNRRQLFKEIVEPLYRDLGPVVDDYYLLFAQSIERVKAADAAALPSVIADVGGLRAQMFRARAKVCDLADAFRHPHQDRRLQQFCDRLLALFCCTRLSLDGGMASRGHEFVELLDQLEGLQSRSSKGVMVDALRVVKDQAAQSWMRLNQTCTSLGLASLH